MSLITLTYENIHSLPDTEITLDSKNTIAHLTQHLAQYSSIVLLTDDTVWKFYETLLNDIRNRFVDVIVIPAGESSKNIPTIASITGRCASANLDRNSVLVAFGGGVVTDIGGFVASIFLRGINWIAVPTTIIGAVDAAIGGKTGVDLPNGKNLVGTFHPSQSVIIDDTFFSTLPTREIVSGWGEIVKYGILLGGSFWKKLHDVQPNSLPGIETIESCIAKKLELVSKDLYDRNERRLLNLGHTAGHALEAATGYDSYRHGEAILWGLGVSAELSYRLKLLPEIDYKDILQILRKFDVPKVSMNADSILPFLTTDKKRSHGTNRWVVINGIGSPEVIDNVPPQLVRTVIENRISFLQSGKVAG